VCCILLDHMQHLVRLDRNSDPTKANNFFVEKVLESDNPGWFGEFIAALQNAGTCVVCV